MFKQHTGRQKERKGETRKQKKQKTKNKMVDLTPNTSVISLNASDISTPI